MDDFTGTIMNEQDVMGVSGWPSSKDELRGLGCLLEALPNLGYCALPSTCVMQNLSSQALAELPKFLTGFEELPQDRFMNDGGTYRYRRFSRLRLERVDSEWIWEPLSGNSILQTLEDNPLHGGLLRTYPPLTSWTLTSNLLAELVALDRSLACTWDPDLFQGPVAVGIHQVRIVAQQDRLGHPTPEGIHRDSERFTFQHMMARVGVQGGEFRAYDESKCQVYSWLQEESLDSVAFLGTTWHNATPIVCEEGRDIGYRDILLVDFDPL